MSADTKQEMWLGERIFRYSTALILGLTSLAKLISVLTEFGLTAGDPVLRVPYSVVFLGVGSVELVLASRFIQRTNSTLDYWLLGGFCVLVLIYRVALHLSAASISCPCMGIARSWIPGGQSVEAFVERGLVMSLAFMFVGSLVYGVRCYTKTHLINGANG